MHPQAHMALLFLLMVNKRCRTCVTLLYAQKAMIPSRFWKATPSAYSATGHTNPPGPATRTTGWFWYASPHSRLAFADSSAWAAVDRLATSRASVSCGGRVGSFRVVFARERVRSRQLQLVDVFRKALLRPHDPANVALEVARWERRGCRRTWRPGR